MLKYHMFSFFRKKMDMESFFLVLIIACIPVISSGRGFKENKRIIGGVQANRHEFPWQAGIQWAVGPSKGEHICGGSLIDTKYVLTAAHCFVHGADPLYYFVILGDHTLDIVHPHEQLRNIKRIIIHHRFDDATYDNDIALIELKTPAILNQHIWPISLPQFLDFEFPGLNCVITGWGRQNISLGFNNLLHKAIVPLVNFAVCNHDRSYAGKLTGNMFCAGNKEGTVDACKGDSGGPLQCQRRKKWVLNGITSWGEGCGVKHKYGVYTTVRHYLKWINNYIYKGVKGTTTQLPPIPPVPFIPP